MSLSQPSFETGLIPIDDEPGNLIFVTPISACSKRMIFSASGVPVIHSMPAYISSEFSRNEFLPAEDLRKSEKNLREEVFKNAISISQSTLMYRTIEDFTADWLQETESTLKIFRTLTDASLGQHVTPDGRSLGFLAWHITLALGEMGERSGLHVAAPGENAPMPNCAKKIASMYLTAARSIADEVQKQWTDTTLREEVEMYGEKWKRGFVLTSLLMHQTHHRGQMTVLMRQAGLNVPGVCGPSREEWARWGMPAMK